MKFNLKNFPKWKTHDSRTNGLYIPKVLAWFVGFEAELREMLRLWNIREQAPPCFNPKDLGQILKEILGE